MAGCVPVKFSFGRWVCLVCADCCGREVCDLGCGFKSYYGAVVHFFVFHRKVVNGVVHDGEPLGFCDC